MSMYGAAEPKPVIRQMARQLGVHSEALRNWIRKDEGCQRHRARSGGGRALALPAVPELPAEVEQEFAGLRKEVMELRRANERTGPPVSFEGSGLFLKRACPAPYTPIRSSRRPARISRSSSTRPAGAPEVRRRTPGRVRGRACAPGVGDIPVHLRRLAAPCARQVRDAELLERIRAIHAASDGIYGSPRIHAVLRREGEAVSRKRVERLMREAGINGIAPARKLRTTIANPGDARPGDLVGRNFTAPGPNRLWVTDLTVIPTGQARCGSPRSATRSPARSSPGRPRTSPTQTWCAP